MKDELRAIIKQDVAKARKAREDGHHVSCGYVFDHEPKPWEPAQKPMCKIRDYPL